MAADVDVAHGPGDRWHVAGDALATLAVSLMLGVRGDGFRRAGLQSWAMTLQTHGVPRCNQIGLTVQDGVVVETSRQQRDRLFELVLATKIPAQVPRVDFTFETIFNPFSDETAVELELEVNFTWLDLDQSGGWVESHVDVVDKFSPAARPADTSAYTHKLNFEWDLALLIFNWLPEGQWLRNVELEGSLDYVATGLPIAGDVLGNQRFLDAGSPWSYSLLFVTPLAPLRP